MGRSRRHIRSVKIVKSDTPTVRCYGRFCMSSWHLLALSRSLAGGFFVKVEFTTVNTFSNVTGFSHFTMVNTDLVCCGGNGGRMKAKLATVVNFPKTIWFIAGISKLCLFSWHLVALFEMRSLSVTLLQTYTCIFSAASLFFSFFRAKQYSRDVTVTYNFRFHSR